MVCGRILIVLGCCYLLYGCAIQKASCPAGEEVSVNELIYFGTAKPNGVVTSKEWSEFLLGSVTPRFPKGFTVWQAIGQWQAGDKRIVHEDTFILNVIHPDDDRSEDAAREIADTYKRKFNQEAVLRVKSYACVPF
jgi:Protein of unknown function (DUF3574)